MSEGWWFDPHSLQLPCPSEGGTLPITVQDFITARHLLHSFPGAGLIRDELCVTWFVTCIPEQMRNTSQSVPSQCLWWYESIHICESCRMALHYFHDTVSGIWWVYATGALVGVMIWWPEHSRSIWACARRWFNVASSMLWANSIWCE